MISTTSSYILAAVVVITIIIVASVYYYRSNDNNDKQKDKFKVRCMEYDYSMQQAVENLKEVIKGINNNIIKFNSSYDSGKWMNNISGNPTFFGYDLKKALDVRSYLDKLEDIAETLSSAIYPIGEMNHQDATNLYNKYKKYEATTSYDPSIILSGKISVPANYFMRLAQKTGNKYLNDLANPLYNLGGPVLDKFVDSIQYLGCTLRKS